MIRDAQLTVGVAQVAGKMSERTFHLKLVAAVKGVP